MSAAPTPLPSLSATPSLAEIADLIRTDASNALASARRSTLGQFFTPAPVAQLMAGMLRLGASDLRILDPGAGSGALTAAVVAEVLRRAQHVQSISVTAFELDAALVPYLERTMRAADEACRERRIKFQAKVIGADFIGATVPFLRGDLFREEPPIFNCAILNPPYKKFRSDSPERRMLREAGIETSNLYAAFTALALRLVEPDGELVAITPRSFCNGPYFRPFRRMLLDELTIRRIHVFDSRGLAFRDDGVLQENVIVYGTRGSGAPARVEVSFTEHAEDLEVSRREVDFSEVVRPGDAELFIHVEPDETKTQDAHLLRALPATLEDLGLKVSTGRVVDFRVREELRVQSAHDTVPLIYPGHFTDGGVSWPRPTSKKPNALKVNDRTRPQLVPAGTYVLVKRFSAKEERRRVVAAVINPENVAAPYYALENHLNYFHRDGAGLPDDLARGLAAFLNSTLLDNFFRSFNGHTQVNATDLRSLRYPTREKLSVLGRMLAEGVPDQATLDRLVEGELLGVTTDSELSPTARRRVDEAVGILEALGLPREQLNDRSGLVLLALLDMKPDRTWSDADAPILGVTPIMEFAASVYGKRYAPNTRETVRRFTLKQFIAAGLVVANPDNPSRPINSPAYCYQIRPEALAVLSSFGTADWERRVEDFHHIRPRLVDQYAAVRETLRIPVELPQGAELTLSAGGQNEVIAAVLKDFCEHFTPGGYVIYIGDAEKKEIFFDREYLSRLGVEIDKHDKAPDVIVHFRERDWLVLIEAVTSHGPISAGRREELKTLFASQRTEGLVFVSAFMDRKTLGKYVRQIAWETEVWVAEAPTHMLHFNGSRFLGPYES